MERPSPPCIELERVSKTYGGLTVINDLHLTIRDGEFLTFLGPSGCGKTTILRLLAGFERPSSGRIRIKGQDVTDLPPNRRAVNTVFQSYALFPHMTVFDNAAFGLRMRRKSKAEIRDRVFEALRTVKMQDFADRRPSQLSGGQQQRAAIARAVVNKPAALLLDEPLSALDAKLRKEVQLELKELQRTLGITFVFVTHDQEEALSMSDRVAVMNHGVIEQLDAPEVIYETPKNLFVAGFVGEINALDGKAISQDGGTLTAEVEGRRTRVNAGGRTYLPGQRIKILLRPEDIRLEKAGESETDALSGVVVDSVYKGMTVDLIIETPRGKKIMATEFFNEDAPEALYTRGDRVQVGWAPDWEVVLPDA